MVTVAADHVTESVLIGLCGVDCCSLADGRPGGDRRCQACDDCGAFEAHGTVLAKVRAEAEARAGEWPADSAELAATTSSLQLDWLDEPVEVVAAVLTGDDGPVVRVDRPPRAGERVAVSLARTSDGLEIAVSSDEVAG